MTNSRGKILLASLLALAIAGGVLITVILPAEYGWDPLGSGEKLGLLGMAGAELQPLVSQPDNWHNDHIEFRLMPFEAVEYKYRLEAGAVMLYRWRADGEVLFDMHSEPEGAAPGYAETFAKSRGLSDQGSYSAPFSGIHGWLFQNRGEQEITVSLQSSGFYPWAMEFRDGQSYRRDF